MATINNGILELTGTIQHKRGTSAAWATTSYVPKAGELAIATDTGKIKVGNGTDNYNDLPYSGTGTEFPASDGKVYVAQNGAWVQAVLVEKPYGWSPEIDDVSEIVLTVDEDMNVYQLTGNNVEVNA